MAASIDVFLSHLQVHLSIGFLLVVSTAVVAKISSYLSAPRNKLREPPAVPTLLPKIGHLIGMMIHGSEYFTRLSKTTSSPIMTLDTLGTKIYVIQSPQAVQAAYRDQKLSLLSLSLMFLHRVGGAASAFSSKLLAEAKSDGKENYWHDMNKVVRDQLAGGESLREMNSRVLNSFLGVLSGIQSEIRVEDFYIWMWRHLVIAKTDALYGNQNPFKSSKLIDQYWAFEKTHLDLLFRPFPEFLAREPFKGREKVLAALRKFSEYYSGREMGRDVSSLIRARTVINRNWNLDFDSCAATELSLLYGSTANAIPTLYWMVTYIFHDQKLLSALREEVKPVVEVGEGQCVIDVAKMSETCPLLKSTYQETLRMVSRHPGARIVEEDTVLTFAVPEKGTKASYELKKGSVVQMPAGLMHRSEDFWGADASKFDGWRFLAMESGSAADKAEARSRKMAYIPLGGGKHLCPGRHFSFTEILGIATAMISGFELMSGTDGLAGTITVPDQVHPFGLGIVKPSTKGDLSLRIRPRQNWEGKSWSFRL